MATSEEEKLVTLAKAWDAAWNAHDIDAVMAFGTEDTTYRVGTPLGSGEASYPPLDMVGKGKAQLRDIVKGFIRGFHVESWDHKVLGCVVTWRFRNSSDLLRNMGIDFVEGTAELAFEGEKIKSLNMIYSPQSSQKMWDALG